MRAEIFAGEAGYAIGHGIINFDPFDGGRVGHPQNQFISAREIDGNCGAIISEFVRNDGLEEYMLRLHRHGAPEAQQAS